jgi:bifunctional non-homologous end joining protein LigD
MNSIRLYHRDGSSDKTYQAAIEPSNGMYVVNFAYGRRGSTLQTGTKTPAPVDLSTAETLFNKLVKEKRSKGYKPEGADISYHHAEPANTGIRPQLLNPIDEAEASRLIDDSNWCLQEKKDGRRLLLKKDGDQITGINRKGNVVGLPKALIDHARSLSGDFILDGECIGETLYVFDLLLWDENTWMLRPYKERWQAIWRLAPKKGAIQILDTAFDPAMKFQLLQRLKERKAEGVVFKKLDAPYESGRPNSGGPALKHKFTATASFIVAKVNRLRSVNLCLYGQPEPCGNVTIPVNQSIPAIGAVVEVRYLYAFPESGRLFQPVYLGERHDIDISECSVKQLKYKPTESDDEP